MRWLGVVVIRLLTEPELLLAGKIAMGRMQLFRGMSSRHCHDLELLVIITMLCHPAAAAAVPLPPGLLRRLMRC
jgi:hypothetical protein